MIDLTKNPYGKFNGKEMDYVLQAMDSDNAENQKLPAYPAGFVR